MFLFQINTSEIKTFKIGIIIINIIIFLNSSIIFNSELDIYIVYIEYDYFKWWITLINFYLFIILNLLN